MIISNLYFGIFLVANITMIKNNWKTAWRSLAKHRTSAIINIGGLAIGMTAALIIGLWIFNESGFNTWHKNYDRIAKVYSNANYNGEIFTINTHPIPLGTELRANYKADFKYVVMATGTEQHFLSRGDKKFTDGGNYMQPEAPDMLTLNMLKGSRTGLTKLNAILLSQSLAKRLFNNEDPLNKIVQIDNKYSAEVTGIYEDLPENSDFNSAHFIAPLDFYFSCYDWARKKATNWNNITINIYTQLNPGVDFATASSHIKSILASHVTGDFEMRKPALFLQPMSRWHLYSDFKNGVNVTSGQLRLIWLYGVIGAFVLLLACINFMNLSTARSEKRAKEVGIRKTIGSLRSQLVKQFFSESLLVALLAFTLAICLTSICMPWFNTIAGEQISIPYTNPFFWLAGLVFTAFTGILAGIYPALYLSSFNPVRVLKGSFRTGRVSALPRKVLVTLQFTISSMLIIGTIVVYRQVQFAKGRPVGYDREGLVQVAMNSPEFDGKFELIRERLKSSGAVAEVAASASPITSIWSTNTGFSWQGRKNTEQIEFSTIDVTQDYGKAVGWQFVDGRDFSKAFSTDSMGFVLNEAAARLMGLQKAPGTAIQWNQLKDRNFTVLGVVKDMVMESPFADASPTIFFIYPRDGMNYMLLKLNPQQSGSSSMAKIQGVFKKLTPNTPFDYSFVNDNFNRKFAGEERIGKVASSFAILAILISCLGLFGMASFMAEQRIKEIGVRKVLGASVFNLWRLMSKEFVVLVVISLLIAAPTAWYFMHNWLQNYQYRTTIAWWVFAATGAGALVITIATVSYQSIKAALANPVKSLRSE